MKIFTFTVIFCDHCPLIISSYLTSLDKILSKNIKRQFNILISGTLLYIENTTSIKMNRMLASDEHHVNKQVLLCHRMSVTVGQTESVCIISGNKTNATNVRIVLLCQNLFNLH